MTSIQQNELQGAYTALITPMDKEGRIDNKKLDILIEDQIAAGIDGLLACGTTGQSATLDHREQILLAKYVYEVVDGRVQMIYGAGSNCTKESILLSKGIEEKVGPATFLHVTGYYNNPPQEGLIAHYTAVADSIDSDSNLIIYNVPGRTASYIEPETAITLSKNPKIIGLKQAVNFGGTEEDLMSQIKDICGTLTGDISMDASDSLKKASALVDNLKYIKDTKKIIKDTCPGSFRLLSGEDKFVVSMLDLGGYGVISASANIAPKMFKDIVSNYFDGNKDMSVSTQEKVNPLVDAVFCAKNPIPLDHMFKTSLRLPLVKIPRVEEQIQKVLAQYNAEDLGIDLNTYK